MMPSPCVREEMFSTMFCLRSSNCTTISYVMGNAPRRVPTPPKSAFSHSWLADRTLSATGLWWLCYQENYCTCCLLSRKHDSINARNTSKVWNEKPSVRLRKVAIADHLTTEQHKNAVNAELLQRISCFHEQLKAMRENNETIIEKTFTAIYWFARQEISNEKL